MRGHHPDLLDRDQAAERREDDAEIGLARDEGSSSVDRRAVRDLAEGRRVHTRQQVDGIGAPRLRGADDRTHGEHVLEVTADLQQIVEGDGGLAIGNAPPDATGVEPLRQGEGGLLLSIANARDTAVGSAGSHASSVAGVRDYFGQAARILGEVVVGSKSTRTELARSEAHAWLASSGASSAT